MKFIKNLYRFAAILAITCFLFSCEKEHKSNEKELTTDEINLNIDDEELRKSFGEEGITIISKEEEHKRLLEFAAEDEELQQLINQHGGLSNIEQRSASFCDFFDWMGLKFIYDNLGGSGWNDQRGWDAISNYSTPPANCDLRGIEGVSIHEDERNPYTNQTNLGRVKMIDLNHLGNVIGEIPNIVHWFAHLNIFQIQRPENVTGSIPFRFRYCESLYRLTITDTNISGAIPPEIGMIPSLRNLYLINNLQLSGSLPGELGDLNLTRVNLSNNNLSGCYDSNLNSLCSVRYWAKTHISLGNIFDASFADFCNYNSGTCL